MIYFGVDVSKDHLDFAKARDPHCVRVDNRKEGIKHLVKTIKIEKDPFVVLEATGGYELAVTRALIGAGVPVARVNPYRPRAYALAIGVLAKTDKIDARILARFGEGTEPEPMEMPDEATQELQELVRRRRDLVDTRSAERNRMKLASKRIKRSIQRHIEFLNKQIKQLEDEIEKTVDDNPKFVQKAAILRSVRGVGPIVAATLIAMLPELGRMSRAQIAALAGLAPFNDESGKADRPRHIRGGRREVRGMLHMAATSGLRYNPRIKAFYERLVLKGKQKKVAQIAASRKLLTWLNAMMRTQHEWDDSLVLAT